MHHGVSYQWWLWLVVREWGCTSTNFCCLSIHFWCIYGGGVSRIVPRLKTNVARESNFPPSLTLHHHLTSFGATEDSHPTHPQKKTSDNHAFFILRWCNKITKYHIWTIISVFLLDMDKKVYINQNQNCMLCRYQ